MFLGNGDQYSCSNSWKETAEINSPLNPLYNFKKGKEKLRNNIVWEEKRLGKVWDHFDIDASSTFSKILNKQLNEKRCWVTPSPRDLDNKSIFLINSVKLKSCNILLCYLKIIIIFFTNLSFLRPAVELNGMPDLMPFCIHLHILFALIYKSFVKLICKLPKLKQKKNPFFQKTKSQPTYWTVMYFFRNSFLSLFYICHQLPTRWHTPFQPKGWYKKGLSYLVLMDKVGRQSDVTPHLEW